MPTINQLSGLSQLSSGDLLPIYVQTTAMLARSPLANCLPSSNSSLRLQLLPRSWQLQAPGSMWRSRPLSASSNG